MTHEDHAWLGETSELGTILFILFILCPRSSVLFDSFLVVISSEMSMEVSSKILARAFAEN